MIIIFGCASFSSTLFPSTQAADGKEPQLWQKDWHVINLQVIKDLEEQQSQTDQADVAQLEVCAGVKRSCSIKHGQRAGENGWRVEDRSSRLELS